jgi:hypothetical protein
VTYNFDADRWLARQLDALGERRRRGELDDACYRREREALKRRHEQMLDRLDGTFTLPPSRDSDTESRDDEQPPARI